MTSFTPYTPVCIRALSLSSAENVFSFLKTFKLSVQNVDFPIIFKVFDYIHLLFLFLLVYILTFTGVYLFLVFFLCTRSCVFHALTQKMLPLFVFVRCMDSCKCH